MKKSDLRIIFMGTSDFAVEPLKCLVEGGYNVVAVVTQPDKPVGRHGSILQASAVKEYAKQQNLPILQPVKMKDPEFVEEIKSYNANLQVVVAFRMLPEVIWSMPKYGTFNVHAALLPQYRGAAPINWAIINGETKQASPRSSWIMILIQVRLSCNVNSLSRMMLTWNTCRRRINAFRGTGLSRYGRHDYLW